MARKDSGLTIVFAIIAVIVIATIAPKMSQQQALEMSIYPSTNLVWLQDKCATLGGGCIYKSGSNYCLVTSPSVSTSCGSGFARYSTCSGGSYTTCESGGGTTPSSCSDSDGGQILTTKGTVTYGTTTYTDNCPTTTTIKEYYCSGSSPMSATFNCPSATPMCSSGKCIASTTPSCTENWQCGTWSACSSSNTQTRTCTDSNNCGTTASKPATSQSCSYATYTCSDSDGGKVYGTAGTVTLKAYQGGTLTATNTAPDYCADSSGVTSKKILREYSCDSSTASSGSPTYYDCSTEAGKVCYEGACQASTNTYKCNGNVVQECTQILGISFLPWCTDIETCVSPKTCVAGYSACQGPSCTESWTCTGWGACSALGYQYRTCSDANKCGTTVNKPTETQTCVCTPVWVCAGWGACTSSGMQTRICSDTCCGSAQKVEQQACTYVPACTPNWKCSAWNDCTSSETQTRLCWDANSCGTTSGKPAESQTCEFTCQPDWTCTGWTTCTTGGQQTRTCTDGNSCGTETGRPSEAQSCTPACTPDWTCGSWGACSSGAQSRTCTDGNNCGTTTGRPAISQSCLCRVGDEDCDNVIRKLEVTRFIDRYKSGLNSKQEMLNLVQAWVDGGGQ